MSLFFSGSPLKKSGGFTIKSIVADPMIVGYGDPLTLLIITVHGAFGRTDFALIGWRG